MHKIARSILPFMLLGLGAGVVIRMPHLSAGVPAAPATTQPERWVSPGDWVAAAPGLVEPISGEYRVHSQTPGNIEGLFVKTGDQVERGQLLAIVDDREQLARLRAAEAEVAFRESEREAAIASSVSNSRRDAEDNIARVEADVRHKQEKLDRLAAAARPLEEMTNLKTELTASVAKLAEAQQVLQELEATGTASHRTRAETALQVARAESGVAYAAFEKTRIRAPGMGTILHVAKLVGDLATPAIEDPVLILGDVSRLRASVETEATDLNVFEVGQSVTIRSDAFPDQEFRGRISQIGVSIRPRRLASQSASLTPKDTSLNVIVELDAGTPLLPGMRIDTYFQPVNLSQKNGGHHASN